MVSASSPVPEPVPNAAHREDVLRVARVPLDLLAQVSNVDVDRSRVAKRGAAPELPEQRLTAVHAAGARRERPEKLERDSREPELIFTVRGVGYRFREP